MISGQQDQPQLDLPYIPFSSLQVLWKTLPGLLKAQRNSARDIRLIPEFIAATPGWCRTMRATIHACLDASSLLALWKQSIKPGVVRACSLLRSTALAMADPATQFRLELTNLVGETDANAILSNLSGASGDLARLGPLLGLAKVRDGQLSRETYMERYGHRGPHEMELFARGADEDPDWLEKQLGEFSHSAMDMESLLAKQHTEYLSAWQRFEVKFPNKVKTTRSELAPEMQGRHCDIAFAHSASKSIIDNLARQLNFGDKVVNLFPEFGNTVSASIPTAICWALENYRLRRGMEMMLFMGSGGFSVGICHMVY